MRSPYLDKHTSDLKNVGFFLDYSDRVLAMPVRLTKLRHVKAMFLSLA